MVWSRFVYLPMSFIQFATKPISANFSMASQQRIDVTNFYPFDDDYNAERYVMDKCVLHTPDAIYKYNVPNAFNVLHVNCCSLKAKFADIEMFLLTLVNPPSVLVLTESWITQYSKFPTMLDYGYLHSRFTTNR